MLTLGQLLASPDEQILLGGNICLSLFQGPLPLLNVILGEGDAGGLVLEL
jgi:hypothetical protein